MKDQKLNKKQLTSIPEFKQHLLQPLHHLDVEFQITVLQKVIDEDLSLKEMKEETVKFHALENVKRTFVRCTNAESWVDARNKFPTFAKEDRLEQFLKLDFKYKIPDVFQGYCQSALSSKLPALGKVSTIDNVKVAVIKGELSWIAAQDLIEVDPTYTGAQLILVSVPCKVSTFTIIH